MNDKKTISFKCLEVKQPLGEFYIGVMDYDELIYISKADIRRLETGNEKREVEIYSGIQRELSLRRVKEIGEYVNTVDATFPTGIIIHLDQDKAEYDEESGLMTILYEENIAKVLDGQHRIAGLEYFSNSKNKFQLNVTIFIGVELEDQAIVFATINKTQTKVNKSLVADLYAFATTRSPQKTAHNIVRALNQTKGSPFKDKIKILGTAIDKDKETITQANFTDRLIELISKNPLDDRDVYKRGNTPEKYKEPDLSKYPLRNLFIDEEDAKIAKLIRNYFLAVQKKWPAAWDEVKPEMVLNKSAGFIALMRFFRDVYNSFDMPDQVVDIEQFAEIFSRIKLKETEFTKDIYVPGSGGQAKLYKDLMEQSGLAENS